jgi:hypothetical protein
MTTLSGPWSGRAWFGTTRGKNTTLIPLVVAFLAALSLGLACSSDSSAPCSQGSARCPCYPNRTCNAGLQCYSSVCVLDERGRDAGGDGPAGEGGGLATGGVAGSGGQAGNDVSTGGAGAGGDSADASIVSSGGVPGHGGGSDTLVSSAGGAGQGGAARQDAAERDAPSGSGGLAPGLDASSGGRTGAGGAGQGGTPSDVGFGTGGAGPGQGGTSLDGGTVPATGGAVGSGGAAPPGTGGAGQAGATGSGGSGGSGGSCGEPDGGYVFYDGFECGTSHWTPYPNSAFSLVVDGSETYAGSSSSKSLSYAVLGNTVWANVRIEVRVKALTFGTADSVSYVGVFGRLMDANNYSSAIHWMGNAAVAISNRKNGGGSDAYDMTNQLVTGRWYTLRIDMTDTGTTIYVDDKRIIETAGPPAISGPVGVGAFNATARFDDVRITPL